MTERTRGRLFTGALLGCLVSTIAGCDGLLEVELPGNVEEAELNNPVLAATLALGAQSDFECAFGAWMMVTELWTSGLDQSSTLTTHSTIQARRAAVNEYGTATCNVDGSPLPYGFWSPLNVSRVQARAATGLIQSFGAIPDADFLLARLAAYEGYSTLLLAESFCELYFDGGLRETRANGFNRAVVNFTSAIASATAATPSATTTAAQIASIQNMALVGRARANLNLGNSAAVLTDAGAVTLDFVRTVDRSGLISFRYNPVFFRSQEGKAYSVPLIYRDTLVSGVFRPRIGAVPDPRVGSFRDGVGNNQFTPQYTQNKYLSRAAPIPFSTWKEARLMIAEVSGGATAVTIINTLRARYPGLPVFSSSDPAAIAAQVRQERQRELWLQGTRMGDMLRWGTPFPTGVTPANQTIVDTTPWCFPTMEAERLGNPNVG